MELYLNRWNYCSFSCYSKYDAIYVYSRILCISYIFAVLGIYLIYKYKIIGYFLGTFLFAFSLGIYQGYYPLTASIFVIILIKMCINQKFTFKEVVLKGIKFFSALLVGYVLYRLFLEYFLFTNNISLSSYEGIDEMGKIDLTLLPEQIKNIYKTLIKMPFSNYNEINGTRIIRYSFLGMYIITFVNFLLITKKNFQKKNLSLIGLVLVLLIILPISIDSIVILVPNGRIYTLMQMAFVCIFYLAIITSDYNLEINSSSYINKLLNFSISLLQIMKLCFTFSFTILAELTVMLNGSFKTLIANFFNLLGNVALNKIHCLSGLIVLII